jgi:hypothetical protein
MTTARSSRLASLLDPALDQYADGFRPRVAVGLRPFVQACSFLFRQAQPDHGIAAGCGPAAPALFWFSRY